MGGRYVITLVTGHVLAIIWGYAVTAHESVTRQAISLLKGTGYTDVIYATIAWFLLLLIAAISPAPCAAASATRPGTSFTC